jgi:hypothetical protein
MRQDWIPQMQEVCADGVNTANRPNRIGQYQLAWGGNISVRETAVKSRGNVLIQRATLPKGRVQGVGYFSRDGGQFIMSIWGQLHRMLVAGNNVTIDSIPLEFRNSSILPQCWMCETDGSFLVQDGQSDCIIYDGSMARRSNPLANEVPLGRQMAYNNGRLWVAVNLRQLLAGDITSDIFQSELKFIETGYFSGGGAFYFKKPITALGSLPANNTNTGFGSLAVMGSEYVHMLRSEITARDLWAQIPGFEVVALPFIGAAGQGSVIDVNQDIYWRDAEGNIWSLRSAISDAQGPGNSPISREVSRIVDFETETQVPYCSGIYFDNRIIFTASPFYDRFGAATFKKLIALDVAPTSTMRGKSFPAYDGEWNGVKFSRVFTGDIQGKKRAFAISTDDDGENRLWEFMTTVRDDASYVATGTGNGIVLTPSPVTSYAEYRRFDFGNPGQKKRLMRCDLWPTELQGECDVQVYWRTDNRTQWQLWGEFSVCATMTNEDDQWLDLAAQERGRVKTLTAPTKSDAILNQAQDVGFSFQIRLAWTGKMLLDRIVVWADPLTEQQFSELQDLSPTCKRNSIVNNQISYSIPVGGLGEPYKNQDGEIYVDSFGIPYTEPTVLIT